MKINQNPTTFNGIKLSQADVLGHRLDVYKLTESDNLFTSMLAEKINLKQLTPNISKDEFEIYDYILKNSLNKSKYENNNSMLLACDNQPCGIIVNGRNNSRQLVEGVCTWPYEKNVKAPFGAQTLFTQVYKDFLETELKFIELHAIRIGSAISKYLHLGFASYGGDNYTEVMRISRSRVNEYYQKLKEKINLFPSSDNTNHDLFKELKH